MWIVPLRIFQVSFDNPEGTEGFLDVHNLLNDEDLRTFVQFL